MVRHDAPGRSKLRFMAFLAPCFGKRRAFPFPHGGQRQHMPDPAQRRLADVEAIGPHPKSDRRIKGVDGCKGGSGQEWSAETGQSFLPQFGQPGDVAVQCGRRQMRLHSHADIHRAIIAQSGEAAMHFRHGRLRPGSRRLLPWPDLRMPVRQVKGDAQRIPHRPVPIDQDRHLARGRKFTESDVVFGSGKRLHPVAEGNGQRLHQHPGAQRPARIIPVGGDEGVGHRLLR